MVATYEAETIHANKGDQPVQCKRTGYEKHLHQSDKLMEQKKEKIISKEVIQQKHN